MRVLIASGGSGGHIFPAVSLAEELKKDNVEIIFVASRRRLDRNIIQNRDYKKIFLSANPMPYKFSWRFVTFLAKLAIDSICALYILLRFRPDVVVGFGGYIAGAILLLAAMDGHIKTVIHEQNLVPGRTNRLLERFVDSVAISFPDTKKYFRNKNVVFTGNPLREESLKEYRSEAFNSLGLERDKMTILVMGGSQGASSLNDLVSRSISLLPSEKKKNIQLVHIAGPKEPERIQKRYNENGIQGKVLTFIRDINEAYSVSDLAISRSGAAAIFELAAFKKPMVLIPYPDRKNNQRFNAGFFAGKNAAICIDEKNTGLEELRDLITELVDNPAKRKALSENAGRLSVVDGARRLKELVQGQVSL
ncbi:MAG: undecaprenyldiphospho-muramoylpentapeptide beta-N-acetylglucosaminyltransferase [Candidatus Omnitrophota bacterium]|nr:MAG: undecaprenyldiphospho-muramoylpentapeptide beta-N-acetylglucosaminyltransferase [Candidatus Omnitrophota bacterium]